MSVAGLIVVRKDSERVPNKALRPFGDTTLFDLCLEKFRRSAEINRLYVCAHEEEFLSKARAVPDVVVVERTYASAHGETIEVIYDFLHNIEEEWLVNINVCCPLFKIATFDAAIRSFREGRYQSMMPVTAIRDWVFGDDGSVFNKVDARVISSKELKPVYKATHPFLIYSKSRLIDDRVMWGLKKDDPYLFEIDETEAIDIDYPHQFEQAEALYLYLKERGRLDEYLR
jgi:CMP-N-acetylneuraminic acid synthetase